MTHQMDDIEILCKHLAQNLNIDVEFQDDIPPHTDGKTVYLPTSMNRAIILELLGALIHETSHIRYTNMDTFRYIYEDSPVLCDVVNVLEDIRIDYKVCSEYPHANELFYLLYRYCTKKSKENLQQENMPYKILKHLILKAKGFSDLLYDEEALKVITELNLDEFYQLAQQAQNTEQIKDLAVVLIATLKKYFGDKKLPESSLTQPSITGTNPEKKEGEETKEANQQPNQENSKDIQEQTQKVKDIKNSADKKYDNYKQSHSKLYEAQETLKNKEAAKKRMNTTVNKKKDRLNYDTNLTEKEQEKLEKSIERSLNKIEEYKQLISDLIQQVNKARIEYNNNGELFNKEKESYKRENKRLELMNKEGSNENLFGLNRVELGGFSSIGDDIIKEQFLPKEMELEKSLDQQVREYFVNKQEQRQYEDEGRISRNRIYRVATYDNNIYQDTKVVDKQTYIALLLDCSGSMSGGRYQRKAESLLTATKVLAISLKRVIEENNLPVKLGIYQFDDKLYPILEFDEYLDVDKIQEAYRAGVSTCLLESVNKLVRIMQDKGNDADRVMLVISDAEVNNHEIKTLRNQILPEVKIIYIGIQASLYTDDARQLFKHNIQELDKTLDVLTDIILERS